MYVNHFSTKSGVPKTNLRATLWLQKLNRAKRCVLRCISEKKTSSGSRSESCWRVYLEARPPPPPPARFHFTLSANLISSRRRARATSMNKRSLAWSGRTKRTLRSRRERATHCCHRGCDVTDKLGDDDSTVAFELPALPDWLNIPENTINNNQRLLLFEPRLSLNYWITNQFPVVLNNFLNCKISVCRMKSVISVD